MIDPSEVPLDKTPPPVSSRPSPHSAVPWLLASGVFLVGGVVAWYFLSERQGDQQAAAPPAAAAAAAPLVPAHGPGGLCPATDEIALPPLDASDEFAGTLATTLSAHPRVTSWLATDDLIRRFVVVVDAVATGKSPATHLAPLRPSGTFRAIERGNELFADPRNSARFVSIAEAVESVDVAGAQRICSALKPRLVDAYRELGRSGTFDEALERAIVSLLQTPTVGPVEPLVPQGGRYGYEDPALEALTPAQKHLARMGEQNTRAIQDKLRQIALAIGIPLERLPQ
jgi:hypothetical protein